MRIAICLVSAAVLHAAPPTADSCREAAPEDSARLASYLVRKYHIPATNNFRLDKDERLEGWYHKLLFRGKVPLGEFQYTIFASPDLRFLTADLFDSYTDPGREEREHARKVMTELLAGEHGSRGPQSAPVTLVLFSDFQCPYCRKLEDLLAAEPLLRSSDKIRLVFRRGRGLRRFPERDRLLAVSRCSIRPPAGHQEGQRGSHAPHACGEHPGIGHQTVRYLCGAANVVGGGDTRPRLGGALGRARNAHSIPERRADARH